MCDKLVNRIDQVDTEVLRMVGAWKSVEEGGKSASQKLLDERVSSVKLDGLYERLMALPRRSRIGWWDYKGDWDDLGIFPRAGACDPSTQSPRGVSRPNRLFLYGRTCGYLHRAHQIPRTIVFRRSPPAGVAHTGDSAITDKRKHTSCVSGNV